MSSIAAALLLLLLAPGISFGSDRESAFDEDVARFTSLLASPLAERRVEGVQGLSHLKHWPAEEALIRLLDDPSRQVRRETVIALGRLGTARSLPHLIQLLDDSWWELRQNAWLGLKAMTAQNFPPESRPWKEWWQTGSPAAKIKILLAELTNPPNAGESPGIASRRDRLRALRHLVAADAEETLLTLIETAHAPPLSSDERGFIVAALERAGTSRSVPALARQRTPAAAWALGHIGGPEAEQALLAFPKDLATWTNLDRLKSKNCAPFIPELVASFGLVTYRSQPDDLHMDTPQPIQRVAANLIIRSGQAPRLIDAILRELEGTMDPPVPAATPEEIPEWKPMLENMREELKPGFVRGDGRTTSQPLTALYHVAEEPALAPRLMPLLRHPAFVARVYVGMLLGKLRAPEAVPLLIQMVEEGYPFSDAVELASGKHFDKSQTVRWRGFLCMALGRAGTDEAREALEKFAADAGTFRDIRYSAVVGLGFIGSPKSLPVLLRVAEEDVIWMIRDTARQVAADIQLLNAQ